MSHYQTARLITYALIVMFLVGLAGKFLGGDEKIFGQMIALYLLMSLPVGGYLAWVFLMCEHPERTNPHFQPRQW